MAESKIIALLAKCENELEKSFENGDNKRILVKTLQEIASEKYDLTRSAHKLENIFHTLWDHSVLLEDCILVSGIIFTKMNQNLNYLELSEKVKVHAKSLKNEEWVYVSLIRGILLNDSVLKSQAHLNQLVEITISAINSGLTSNRSVLISRQLENLLSIFAHENILNVYDFQSRGAQIISIVNRTLRLNADLTDYKSRDLIKWHLSVLSSLSLDNSIYYTDFAAILLHSLPEVNKVTVQICDSLSAFDFKNYSIPARILTIITPCLHIKGGLGSAAASCIGKLLTSQSDLNSWTLLPNLIDQIFEYPSSRDIIKIFNLLLGAVGEHVKVGILDILKSKKFSLINQLLIVNIEGTLSSSDFENLLTSNDEFVALEAFSLLTRDSIKKRRKPIDSFSRNDLTLFESFINDVVFSGSVDFRQKVSVSAKSFYDQIFSRIYHLIRELSKLPRDYPVCDDSLPTTVDRECLALELHELFDWLGRFVKFSLVEPFDFCQSHFGSVEFAFTQILSIFSAFDGNATLVAANSAILSHIASQFRSSVVEFALTPSMNNFIRCVGKSTYDILRLRAMDIICKCNIDASSVPLEEYYPALKHPRAINNEGAARIILLHAQLSKTSEISSVITDLTNSFKILKSDFPNSLRDNNINGRLLLLKFMIQDQTTINYDHISEIISLSMEISNFVSEIASHPSPEGLNLSSMDNLNNEDEDEDTDCFEDNIDGNDLNSKELFLSSQYVLSFSWRAVKETSTVLETLLKIHRSCVSQEQIYSIADHFISLLLKLRHCGAFRALQTPLSTTLRLGYSYSKKTELLQHVLKVCLGTGQITTTRRSAGLPFLVLALAHSCSSRGNELGQLLGHLLPTLLSTANSHIENLSNLDYESNSSISPSVIHAFNIIRSLVRDSRIASEMGPYMASVAKLCLGSFNSDNWNVRNASAMLFSSLISRIFGPKCVNDISNLDQHVDLREIDIKFEGLVGVLTSFLQIESLDLEPRIAYPLLAVFERIRIPPNERFEELRTIVTSFLLVLLVQLDKRPESGRKLGHVLGRTIFSLLSSRSLRIEDVHEKLLILAPKSTAYSIYNLIVLLENVKKFDSNYNLDGLLPPLKSNWHPILISKYNQVLSHKSDVNSNSREEKESPVISSHVILEELNKRLPNIHLICINLESENVSTDIIYKIFERFKLNEEILMIALPILCCGDIIDDRLVSLLSFYSASDNNENIRLIVLRSLKMSKFKFFKNIPQCIFSLLLDDDEDIRMGICTVLNSAYPSSPAKTLKNYINFVGTSEFIKFLDNYQEKYLSLEESNIKLFEKEALNLFIDIQYLRKNFCPK